MNQNRYVLTGLPVAVIAAACSGGLSAETDGANQRELSDAAWGSQSSSVHISHTRSELAEVQGLAGVYAYRGRLLSVDGKPLATGETPRAAAAHFVARYARAAGLPSGELEPDPEIEPRLLMTGSGADAARFTLFTYRQQRAGLRVYGAQMQVMVRNATNAVVWAAAALRDLGTFELEGAPRLLEPDLEQSRDALLRRAPTLRNVLRNHLPEGLTSPEAVIYAEPLNSTAQASRTQSSESNGRLDAVSRERLFWGIEGTGDVRLAMRYRTTEKGAWSFVADAQTGEVLRARSLAKRYVDGHVKGEHLTIAGTLDCAGASSPKDLPHARVELLADGWGTIHGYADESGEYAFPFHPTPGAVRTAATGYYFRLNDTRVAGPQDADGLVYQLKTFGTQDTTLNFFLEGPNDLPTDNYDASSQSIKLIEQTTVYYALNVARAWVKERAPNFPKIDDPVDVLVASNNVECYNGLIGLANPGHIDICPKLQGNAHGVYIDVNSGATLDVAYHEYGHILLFNGAPHLEETSASDAILHEGIADIITALITGIPTRGVGLMRQITFGPVNQTWDACEPTRSVSNSCVLDEASGTCSEGNMSCDCQGALSGAAWDLINALYQSGYQNAHDVVSDLTLNYIQLNHISGAVDSSVVLDFLALDDDDGNLQNGTPHSDEICLAFEAHGFECPTMGAHICTNECGNYLNAQGCGCDNACETYDDCCSPSGVSKGDHFKPRLELACGT